MTSSGSAVVLEEGRVHHNPQQSAGIRRSSSLWSSISQLFPSRAATRSERSSQRHLQRPRPISVQRSMEMPLINLPVHIHRDSFLFKSKKRSPTLNFIFDAASSTSGSSNLIDVAIYDKEERLEIVKAHAGELKQHLCFRSIPTSLLGKSLEVRTEYEDIKEITRLELIQSINGYIDARVHSQRVLGKLHNGAPFDYYLLDIYGQPFKMTNGLGDEEESFKSEVNRECIICLSERRDTIVLPCRHMCLCAECAEALRARADRCPMCREGCQALLEIKGQAEEPEMTSVQS